MLACNNYAVAVADTVYALTPDEVIDALSRGDDVYAKILPEAMLCTDAQLTDGLFVLPETYYVKIITYDERACRVTYCYEDYDYARGVCGFVSTARLIFCLSKPTGRSFPNVFLEFEGNGTFYKNNGFDTFYTSVDSTIGEQPFFYGYLRSDTDSYCYVLMGGRFGYYSADVFAPVEISPHPSPAPAVRVEPPAADEPATSGGLLDSDGGKAIFIVCACLVAVGISYLIFLPRRPKEQGYDEED